MSRTPACRLHRLGARSVSQAWYLRDLECLVTMAAYYSTCTNQPNNMWGRQNMVPKEWNEYPLAKRRVHAQRSAIDRVEKGDISEPIPFKFGTIGRFLGNVARALQVLNDSLWVVLASQSQIHGPNFGPFRVRIQAYSVMEPLKFAFNSLSRGAVWVV